MKFMLLVYNDPALLDAMPQTQFDSEMRDCLNHAADLQSDGQLLGSQQLEPVDTARTVRARAGKLSITDGPFAETKEILGGFNIIEAATIEEACRIASEFPWIKTGSIEVRPVREISAVQARVGAAKAPKGVTVAP
jgi:hypothetical protein